MLDVILSIDSSVELQTYSSAKLKMNPDQQIISVTQNYLAIIYGLSSLVSQISSEMNVMLASLISNTAE